MSLLALLLAFQGAVDVVPRQASPGAIRFAVIGDYGLSSSTEADVAAQVKSWNPDFVVTTGDNNYDLGEAATIDLNIGQYYASFIGNYAGAFGPGSTVNRFFPCLGNHDWNTPGAAPYLAYFTLPGNERTYEFRRGPVAFFILDSDPHEPDGVTSTSVQAQWLQAALAASTAPFKVVVFHHAPFSGGVEHGDAAWMQWPFRAWGASLVLSGHEHDYERFIADNLPYVVNGIGGKSLYAMGLPTLGSRARFNADFGAMLVEADDALLTLRCVTRTGAVVDSFALAKDAVVSNEESLIDSGAVWRYRDLGTFPGSSWILPSFDDSSWAQGPAQLGYGDGDEKTLVGFGPDAANKYVTTYFRRSFNVADPVTFESLRLGLLCDDGAVVYVNGVEAHRRNLPPGPITPLTLASTAASDFLEWEFVAAEIDPLLLNPGANVLAVEVHQAAVTSSDVSFDLKLVATRKAARLVEKGATWRYLDTGVEPAAAWRAPGFDDSSWSSGAAQLGYGDGDEATVVGFGPSASSKYATTYFRKSFQVANPAAVRGLLLRMLCDDGAVVFLNGEEVHRRNLPLGPIGFATLAPFAVGGADESAFLETSLDPRALVPGRNVLAVEVHQSAPTSSDLSFDAELVVVR